MEVEKITPVPPNATTPQQITAAMLHRKCCKYSHEDYCAWYLEKNWEEGSHSFYLKLAARAEEILNQK